MPVLFCDVHSEWWPTEVRALAPSQLRDFEHVASSEASIITSAAH
jgi:hypothetical protein